MIKLLSKVLLIAALALVSAGTAQAQIQVTVGGGYEGPPPPEYIATTPPVYYEGRPAYWYNGYWHYRDEHGGWNYYRQEPVFLANHRGNWGGGRQPGRRYYEHPREYRHEGYRR